MPDLITQLRNLHPKLVSRAVGQLAHGELLRESLEAEINRFYERLTAAVESGSQEWLATLIEEWVASRPASTNHEQQTFIPLLHTLRRCAWEILSDHLPPAEALHTINVLERFFAETSLGLARLETEARIREIEAELGLARAELERLDQSKSDFIAVAAHELKTPLTLIEGYSQLLAVELPGDQYPRVQVLLGGLGNGTRRLKQIIEDMIDVSLIDNNLLALHYSPVNLSELVEHLRAEVEATAHQRRLSLSVEPVEPGLTTYVDVHRLRQVLIHILENAVKFTPDGGSITIRSRRLPGFVEIAVADTGIGIAPENQQRIFEKFASLGDVSLHSSGKTKFKGGGPGLGLPIARGLVAAHGGTLWVESPGYDEVACPGTTVHIMLPLLSEPPEVKEPELLTWAKNPKPWRSLSMDMEGG